MNNYSNSFQKWWQDKKQGILGHVLNAYQSQQAMLFSDILL